METDTGTKALFIFQEQHHLLIQPGMLIQKEDGERVRIESTEEVVFGAFEPLFLDAQADAALLVAARLLAGDPNMRVEHDVDLGYVAFNGMQWTQEMAYAPTRSEAILNHLRKNKWPSGPKPFASLKPKT